MSFTFQKVKRQPTLIISLSQHFQFFAGQPKNQAEIRQASYVTGELAEESVRKQPPQRCIYLHQHDTQRPMFNQRHI